MPTSDLLPGVITGGADLAGGIVSAIMQSGENRKNRAFSREMYQWQRQDALADYNMQNDYNSPTSQMARLRAAGLNPNLVYKNGATSDAAPVRSSAAPSAQGTAPHLDLGRSASLGLAAMYDTKVKQAQIDNLKTQNTVMVEDQKLRAAQTLATIAGTAQTQQQTQATAFDLSQRQRLADTSFEAARLAVDQAAQSLKGQQLDYGIKLDLKPTTEAQAKANLANTEADTRVKLDANERAQALQATSLEQAVENILTTRAQRANTVEDKNRILQQVENLKRDGTLKQFEINLRSKGLTFSDPIYLRFIGQAVDNLSAPEVLKKGKEGVGKALQKTSDAFHYLFPQF